MPLQKILSLKILTWSQITHGLSCQIYFVDLMDCSRQSTGPANKIENEIKGYQNHEFSSTDEALIQKHGPLIFFKKKIARNFFF